jgi:phage protein D
MSVLGLKYWDPRPDIRFVRGLPAQVIPGLRDRVASFELTDHDRKIDTAKLSLDNSDGRLFMPDAIAFGVVFNLAFGYNGALSAPRLMQVRKISGAVRFGGVGAQSGPQTAAGGMVSLDMRSKVWDFNIFRGASAPGRSFRQLRFENVTIVDVVRRLALRNGFDGTSVVIGDMPEGEPVLEEIVIPTHMSDAEWIQDEARRRGWTFAVDQDGLHFHSPDLETDDVEELSWFAGEPDVISWDIDGDMNIPPGVSIAGVNTHTERITKIAQGTSGLGASAENPSETGQNRHVTVLERQVPGQPVSAEQIFNVPDLSDRQKQRAEKAINKAINRWKLKLKLVGNPRVRARRRIRLRNFGPLVDGLWWVKEAKHSYRANQVYITEIDARRREAGTGRGRIQRRVHITEGPNNQRHVTVTESLSR